MTLSHQTSDLPPLIESSPRVSVRARCPLVIEPLSPLEYPSWRENQPGRNGNRSMGPLGGAEPEEFSTF